MKLIALLVGFFFTKLTLAQDTLEYTIRFVDQTQEVSKEEIRFLQRLKDSNQVELLFGARFNDTTQIFCQDKEIFNGLLKTNYSISMVNKSFLIDRNSQKLQITFSNRSVLIIDVIPDYFHILVECKHGKYLVVYYKTLNLQTKS